jgi:uncharacterized protein involved in exopolysaccharide biosynthesis
MNKTENHLRFAVLVLFANLRLIAVVSCIAFILSVCIALFVPPVYKLEGTILVKSKRVQDRPESGQVETDRYSTMPPTQEDVLLETRIVTSPDLIEKCVRALRHEGQPVLDSQNRGLIGRFLGISLPEDTIKFDRRCTAAVVDNLQAVIFPGSTMIDIQLKWKNALAGQRILERILDEYPQFRMILVEQSTSSFYAQQVQRYRQTLNELDSNDLSLSRRVGVSDVSMELEQQVRFLQDQIRDRDKLRNDLQDINHDLQYLFNVKQCYSKAAQGDTSTVLPPPVELIATASTARQRINDLLMNYYIEMRQYAVGSVQARQVMLRIRSELDNLIGAEQQSQHGLDAQIAVRKERIDSLRARTLLLRGLITQQQQIATDIGMTREKYQAFASKLDESRMELDSKISQLVNAQVLSRPVVPEHPWFPRPRLVIPFGIIAGLLLSLSLAWVREIFDHTFKTPTQVRDILNLPVIAYMSKKDHGLLQKRTS